MGIIRPVNIIVSIFTAWIVATALSKGDIVWAIILSILSFTNFYIGLSWKK